MKTMKRMAALVLCLSLLIGIPCAVQAVDTSANFELINVYALNNKFTGDWSHGVGNKNDLTNTVFIPYFNAPDKRGWNVKNAINDNTGAYAGKIDILVIPYDADGNALGEADVVVYAVNYYSTTANDTYCAGWDNNAEAYKRVPALQFADKTKGFAEWRTEGAVRFELVILDTNPDTQNNGWVDVYVNPVAGKNGSLKATGRYNDYDAVIKEIIFEEDFLKINTVAPIGDSKLLINFSEPVKIDEDLVNIQLQATTATVLNGNMLPVVGSTVTTTVEESWTAESAKVLGNTSWVEVVFKKGAVAEAQQYQTENGTGLFLNVSDNNAADGWGNNGEQTDNGLIDGIWATSNNSPLVKIAGKTRDNIAGDQGYYWPTSKAVPKYWSEQGIYDDLTTALNAAKTGNTVVMYSHTEVEDRFLEIPADVTLDLFGCNLTVENIFSFGNIIDSTDGKGGLVISNDKTQAFVGLQEGNTYFPLYDNDRYRFFSYEVINAGWRDHASHPDKVEENAMQFGIKVVFNSEKAYDLLQVDGTLVLDLNIDGRNIPYKFNASTMTKLYEKVTENEESWNKRSSAAITLTMSGLNSLESGAVITAVPTLASAGVAGTGSVSEYTYTSAQ